MSKMVSPYNNYLRHGVRPSHHDDYLYNTLQNLQERVRLLEEKLSEVILKIPKEDVDKMFDNYNKDLNNFSKDYPKNHEEFMTVFGTYSFLDCPEHNSKRTVDFYNK